MILRALLLPCLLLTLMHAPSLAQSNKEPLNGEAWVKKMMAKHLRPGGTWNRVRDDMRRLFFWTDLDGNGVSKSDHDTLDLIARAKLRGKRLGLLLGYDLNGDGRITRDELRKSLSKSALNTLPRADRFDGTGSDAHERALVKAIDRLMARDKNGDGVLEASEIVTGTVRADRAYRFRGNRWSYSYRQRVPLNLDEDGDGVVSLKEYEGLIQLIFAQVDNDGNRIISMREAKDYAVRTGNLTMARRLKLREDRQRRSLERRVRQCGLPTLKTPGPLVLVSAYEGAGLSTLSVGPQGDPISVADVTIEPGTSKLHLVLSSYKGIIWRFNGAVDRVETVIATSQTSRGRPRTKGFSLLKRSSWRNRFKRFRTVRSGIVGVPKDKVFFTKTSGCLNYLTNLRKSSRRRATQSIEALLGRSPDVITGAYRMRAAFVPSGRLVNTNTPLPGAMTGDAEGPGAGLWRRMLNDVPGGLIALEPGTVAAPKPLSSLPLLPREAGIAQLLKDGALVVEAMGRSVQVHDGKPKLVEMPTSFRVTRDITLPAGLAGWRGVQFILEKGVSVPKGDKGTACIRREGEKRPVGRLKVCPPRV
ncbi:MAG: hypothetical protein AAFR04_11330 [Pseudomonadota bacterium]